MSAPDTRHSASCRFEKELPRFGAFRRIPPGNGQKWDQTVLKIRVASLPKGRYSRASGGLCFAKPWLDALPGIVAGIERETTPLLPCSVLQGLPVPSEPEHLQARPPKLIGTETLDIWGTEVPNWAAKRRPLCGCNPATSRQLAAPRNQSSSKRTQGRITLRLSSCRNSRRFLLSLKPRRK